MSAAPATTEPFAPADAAGTRRFTADEYRKMWEAGVLHDGGPAELIDGYVVEKYRAADGHGNGTPFPQWSALRKFTVDEYHRLIEAGVLTSDDRVELLDGCVVNEMPQNPPHGGALMRLTVRVSRRLPEGWAWRMQQPITLSASEPEPDAAVVRGDETSYDARHPVPADVGLVIEVSDSSLRFDRAEKGRLYARDGLPVYWALNLVERTVEVYGESDRSADPPAYRARTDYAQGQDVPLVLDGVVVALVPVSDLIP